MARTLTAAMIAEVQAGTIRPVLIAEIETASGFVRAWTGVGDLSFNGETFSGVGNFGGVSPVKETSSLEATGCNFQLSGIPGSLISTALGDLVYGKSATLWLGLLGSDGALVDEPTVLFKGLTDNAAIDEGPSESRISLSAESRAIDLDRPRARRYVPEDQKIDYPTDKGFEFVAAIQDAEIVFGGP